MTDLPEALLPIPMMLPPITVGVSPLGICEASVSVETPLGAFNEYPLRGPWSCPVPADGCADGSTDPGAPPGALPWPAPAKLTGPLRPAPFRFAAGVPAPLVPGMPAGIVIVGCGFKLPINCPDGPT